MGIARRVLATLRRYMLSGEEQPEVLKRIWQTVQAVDGPPGGTRARRSAEARVLAVLQAAPEPHTASL